MITHRHARPAAAKRIGDRLKLHRRTVRADGRDYTVVTLRPDAYARFSTNHFHDTWHILSDLHGARLLGRLLWGLAFERHPGTLILIRPPHLVPNPFDAAPSPPIALVPATLTTLTPTAARRLRGPLPPVEGTVRWHTFSLPAAAEDDRAPSGFERIGRTGGLVAFTAAPAVLKLWARRTYTLGRPMWHGMDYTYLGEGPLCRAGGEVQVFTQYRRMLGVARTARAEVAAEVGAGQATAEQVWDRADRVTRRRDRPQRTGGSIGVATGAAVPA